MRGNGRDDAFDFQKMAFASLPVSAPLAASNKNRDDAVDVTKLSTNKPPRMYASFFINNSGLTWEVKFLVSVETQISSPTSLESSSG